MSMNELHETIKDLKEWKLLKEECEAKITELESIVKDEMRAQELNKMVVGEYKCCLTTVTSNKVDSKELKAVYPDIYDEFLKPSTYERFTVS